MKKGERLDFIKVTEQMVSPQKVAKLFQNAESLNKLPRFLQKKIMEMGSKSEPYISFIVEPYSLFLAYEILDTNKVESMLSKDYELVKTSMFEGAEEKYYAILGAFNVHTSVFWGNRIEVYIIARNKKTNLVSWIIQDYETNTISYDPGRGFVSPTTEYSILTTSFLGEVILDIRSKVSNNKIQLNTHLDRSNVRKLNPILWIDGNFSVDYSNDLSEVKTKPFGLIFDPAEMNEALDIPTDAFELIHNSFLEGIIGKDPDEICCFPYAQHFYTSTIPLETSIRTTQDLENSIKNINRQRLPKHACYGYCYSYACREGCQLKKE